MQTRINAIIADDMETYLNSIEQFVQEDNPHINIVGKATTLKETEQLILEQKPDLVFLDILFEEEGTTCYSLLERLKKNNQINFQIIFITAYSRSDYQTKAFSYSALHYIAKPIDRIELSEAISRVRPIAEYPPQMNENKLKVFFDIIANGFQNQEFVIDMPNGYDRLVKVKDILYMKADGKYTWVYLSPDSNLPPNELQLYADKNLGEYSKLLIEDFDFFRIHHNCLINLSKVSGFNKRNREVILTDNNKTIKLLAAKRKFPDFLDMIRSNKKKFNHIRGSRLENFLRQFF